jgi:hypothetical protein
MNGDTSSDRDRWRGSPRRASVLAVVPGIALLTAASRSSAMRLRIIQPAVGTAS